VGARTRVTPDAATCPDCLAEIRDPADRRFGYAFANCTHCGPRLSILDRLPYDRAQTSMAAFEMCAACRAEYEDPGDRRFHAQPVACAACGPRVWLERDGANRPATARHGGRSSERRPHPRHQGHRRLPPRLRRHERGGHRHASRAQGAPGQAARADGAARYPPAPRRADGGGTAIFYKVPPPPSSFWKSPGAPLPDLLAPGQATLGWMLPYTPLHHLLFDRLTAPLVMTSGNLSGEPQVIGNDEAREKLSRFADAFVMHDRDIRRRLDDSVERVTPHGPMILRRGRGRVPGTLPLPPGFEDAPDTLATGGQMKGAICLTKTGQALLSHHLGDLDDRLCFEEFRKAVADYAQLFDHAPARIACDLHPGYRASTFARTLAGRPRHAAHPVQHHHAHLASCLGEHLWPRDGGAVAGIILDGLGLGTDGTIWGGEVLLGDYAGFERIAWLRPVPLPGGDAANREPWRNALARLDASGLAALADRLLPGRPLATLRHAMAEGLNAPLSSSAGRLFDAFAAFWASTGRRASRARRRWGWRRWRPAAPGAEGAARPTASAIRPGAARWTTRRCGRRARDLATALRPRSWRTASTPALARSASPCRQGGWWRMAAPKRWRCRGAVSRTRFCSISRSKALDGVPVMHHAHVFRPMTAGLRSGRRWWPWRRRPGTVIAFPVFAKADSPSPEGHLIQIKPEPKTCFYYVLMSHPRDGTGILGRARLLRHSCDITQAASPAISDWPRPFRQGGPALCPISKPSMTSCVARGSPGEAS
jgi:hypothetical protein